MSKMKIKNIAATILLANLAVSLPVFGQEAKLPAAADLHSHGVTQDQIESLSEIMHQAVQQEQIAGGSFLVAHKGEIVFRMSFGYADLDSKRPFAVHNVRRDGCVRSDASERRRVQRKANSVRGIRQRDAATTVT